MKDKQRPVTISLEHGAYFVRYVDRDKFQRYSASQFDANYSTLSEVESWVNNNPRLTLLPHNEE